MDFLTSLFVAKPFNILAIAAVFFILFLILRFTGLGDGKNAMVLLVPIIAWALYATGEWAIVMWSPEANIRVDLLIIWPVLVILSVWFLIKAWR